MARGRNAGRKLAALRKKVESRCMVCGQKMKGLKTRKTCSNKCRKRAHEERKATGGVQAPLELD